ncbi:hypothetical protein ACFQ9V_00765 [Leifsonia sp. NPDC056665]|uniref:hypothetical protein n=1 Tax=Leifsonia sp. NPDC056665 TaxID=3345901 RepID=UPI0036A42854
MVQLHYVPAGRREGIWARQRAGANARAAQLDILASWDDTARQIQLDAATDVTCWDLKTVESISEKQLRTVLVSFFSTVIRDNAFWLTTMRVHCMDALSFELLVASRAELARNLNLATRGGLRTLIINLFEPTKKAIDE